MKRLFAICLIAVVGVATAEATAQEPTPAPSFAPSFPSESYEVIPAPSQSFEPQPYQTQSYEVLPGPSYAYPPQPVVLYKRVKVKDARKIHPHAVPTIVEVPDPRNPDCMVCVEICAPPCECLCVKRCGLLKRKIRFDYGEYQVEVAPRLGRLVIDYDA